MKSLALLALLLSACASHKEVGRTPTEVSKRAFVPDVDEAEWTAAIPAKGDARIAEPVVRSGPRQPNPKAVPLNTEQTVVLEIVIRADGSVGVYRVIRATDPAFMAEVIRFYRALRYEPTVLDGHPVAIRGEVGQTMKRTSGPIG